MAFVQIEDLSGQLEAIVFPRTYQEIQKFLIENQLVIIDGKVDQKDDKIQIIIEKMESAENWLEQLKSPQSSMPQPQSILRLNLPIHLIEKSDKLESLKGILEESSGNADKKIIPVEALVQGTDYQKLVRFGNKFWVENSAAAADLLTSAGFQVDSDTED